jgi:hypothetical protein
VKIDQSEKNSHNANGAGIIQSSTRFWVFNVDLIGTGLVRSLFLKEFYDLKPAKQLVQQVAATLRLPVQDESAMPPINRTVRERR